MPQRIRRKRIKPSAMQNAVNNLIYNTLTAERRVVLPTVGTLQLCHLPASMSGSRVVPPRCVVEFSSSTSGRTIIDVIAQSASISKEDAEDIYRRWLDRSRNGDDVVIEGVGTLRHKSFTTDSALLAALNPEGDKPLRLRRRRSVLPWVVSLILLLGVAAGAYLYLSKEGNAEPATTHTTPTERLTEPIEVAGPTNSVEVVEESVDVPTEPTETVVEIPAPEQVVTDNQPWTERQSLRHWVVVGSYSTEQNAKRAIRDIIAKNEDVTCDIFKLGSMYAVAAFASSDHAECEEFVRNHRKEFNQAWIHTPKRFK